MKHIVLVTTLFTLASISHTAIAELNNEQRQIEQYAEKLDKINFLPSMLPTIIENSDVIELTDKQINTLLAWRAKNRKKIVANISQIISKRVELKEAAFSPNVSSARLVQLQNEVFRLQREVLDYKLSCRDLVISTFNANNWEGFFLVLAEKEIGVELPDLYITKR